MFNGSNCPLVHKKNCVDLCDLQFQLTKVREYISGAKGYEAIRETEALWFSEL